MGSKEPAWLKLGSMPTSAPGDANAASVPTSGLPLPENQELVAVDAPSCGDAAPIDVPELATLDPKLVPVAAGGPDCGDTAPVDVPELAPLDPELARLDDAQVSLDPELARLDDAPVMVWE